MAAKTHLFVYGTLMSWASGAFGRAQRERLVREATTRGPAIMAGQLWDLGAYPGLLDSNAPEDVVHGEVFELRYPALSFTWLDAYEGITPGSSGDNRYERVERPARLASGQELTAWVYLYRQDVSRARRLAEGRWTAPG